MDRALHCSSTGVLLRFLISTSTPFHLHWLYVSYSLQIPICVNSSHHLFPASWTYSPPALDIIIFTHSFHQHCILFHQKRSSIGHKNKIYTKGTILRKLSQELPYSVGSFWIWNICHTVSTLQQLQLSPRHFQVPELKFSNVRWIHKNTASLRYRPCCFKHNSSSSTPCPINHHRIIKSSSIPACNSVFQKLFEEAVKSIGVVSWSSQAVFIRYKFFLNFYLSFFAVLVIFSLLFIFFLFKMFCC